MWSKIRTAAVPSVVVVLAAYGMAFAATGSPNPMGLVSSHSNASSHAHVTPKPSHTPDDPTESPEASHTPKPSHGPERSTVGCPDGFTGNHGQFVSSSDDHHAAAQSDCGKPVQAVRTPDPSSSDNGQDVEHGHEQSPEPSESPDPDANGDTHSNDHQGNAGDHGQND
jgi:hypothetical protein